MSSETHICGTGADDAGVGTISWSSPTNITADDGSYALTTGSNGDISHYLKATNFGFSSIPSGAVIEGIEISFQRKYVAGGCKDSTIKLVKSGSVSGTNLSAGAAWTTSDVVVTYGGPTELWGLSWSDTDFDSSFGCVVSIEVVGGVMAAQVDYIRATVYWSDTDYSGGGLYSHSAFLCFRNVQVPKRATIHKAWLTFTAKDQDTSPTEGNTLDDVTAIINANDVDDATPYASYGDFYNSDRTTNCVAWESVEHWTENSEYNSPDIACVIQEIVDRNGWNPGQDMMIYVDDLDSTQANHIIRRCYDYGDDSAKATELNIYYTLDETGSGGVVCGGSADAQRFYSPTITPNGVLCSGSAIVGYIANPVVVAAGVVVSGRGTLTSDYTPSGGVRCGGHGAITDYVTWNGGVLIGSFPYKYKVIITVPSGTTSTDLAGFPLVASVDIDPDHMADGNDWTVTDTSLKPLAHELRRWNEDSGRLTIAVKTNITHSADTTVWLFYGSQT